MSKISNNSKVQTKKKSKRKSKKELFVELAKPDSNGVSNWVYTTEFTGKYADLKLGNGGSWCRKGSSIEKEYNVEKDYKGRAIDAIRLNGFNKNRTFSQEIRSDIKDFYKDKPCVMLGIKGTSINTSIEVDHKDGRKDNPRVSNTSEQELSDFQPLCKAANDAKRQICKKCKETGKRWDARNILGNPYPFYKGDENYDSELGCEGCYQYDPVAYRKETIIRIFEEATLNNSADKTPEAFMKNLYDKNKI